MSTRRMDVVSFGVIGLTAALTAAVYDRLPARMATHFDLQGNANGWMSRPLGAWVCPAVMVGLWGLLRVLPRILPASEQKRLGGSAPALVAMLTTLFLAATQALILRVAIVPGASMKYAIWPVLGAFYIAIGLVLPRIKRNALMGVRTPWTLTSDENWARTQRVGSYAMVVGGVLAMLLGVSGGPLGAIGATAVLILTGLVPVGYSLFLARRLDQGS